jgi:peptide/nickel transport system ATP-binding protein
MPPEGCRFAPRCPYAVDSCREGGQPSFNGVNDDPDHLVSCIHFHPMMDASVVTENPIDYSEYHLEDAKLEEQ